MSSSIPNLVEGENSTQAPQSIGMVEKEGQRLTQACEPPEIKEEASKGVITLDPKWLASLSRRIEDVSPEKLERVLQPTICKVPDRLRAVNPGAYTPQAVSLGPYHHSTNKPRYMDHLKLRYLGFVLRKSPCSALRDYLVKLKGLESMIRSSYSDGIDDIGSNELAEMMLLDGCFILCFIFPSKFEPDTEIKNMHDPVQSTTYAYTKILDDIFLLENQIPFFVLEDILTLTMPSNSEKPARNLLIERVIALGDSWIDDNCVSSSSTASVPEDIGHILHLYYSVITEQTKVDGQDGQTTPSSSYTEILYRNIRGCFPFFARLRGCFFCRWFTHQDTDIERGPPQAQPQPPPQAPERQPQTQPLNCARRLKEAGVKFKKSERAKSFMSVTFQKGVMLMPTLWLYDNTNIALHNLVAFEQCFERVGNSVTAYADVMDMLIDKEEDVALLSRSGCLNNCMTSEDEAATMFNQLCRNATVDDSYLAPVIDSVNKHCNLKRNRWRAMIKHNYFGSPLAIISWVGALIIIFLGIIQLVYAILSFHLHHS